MKILIVNICQRLRSNKIHHKRARILIKALVKSQVMIMNQKIKKMDHLIHLSMNQNMTLRVIMIKESELHLKNENNISKKQILKLE